MLGPRGVYGSVDRVDVARGVEGAVAVVLLGRLPHESAILRREVPSTGRVFGM